MTKVTELLLSQGDSTDIETMREGSIFEFNLFQLHKSRHVHSTQEVITQAKKPIPFHQQLNNKHRRLK